jgi:endonuclease/exonuclease/phosphatase family metal-dependent hydrolase
MKFRDLRARWRSFRGTRLLFETLESRDLLTVMRVVDWNTMNAPNDATADANYQTVLQAIGNETVQGNTERVDILALQETDGPGPGGDSIDRIKSIFNLLYPTTTYAAAFSPVDNGGDSTGFVYDTSSVTLLNSVQIGSGTLTHNILRGEFQPVGAPLSSAFYVYTIHLKSGTAGSDATTRGTEAAFLRSDADSLGDGTQVLFVGDFNMQGSEEAAYTNFVAAGNAQLQDVADAPGHWQGNTAFKNLHSHDGRVLPPNGSGTGMNDRFDIQFASGELFDGVGVDYVPNSFHVFGNNGTHDLNGSITSGTGASPAVLSALAAASDHLPAVGDYQIVSTPNVRISQTLGGTKVVEGGLYDTYQVVLDTVPTANVTVTVTPDSQVDAGNGGGVAKQITFTPANALTPQTVIVHAVDDLLAEGNHTSLITHTSASSDASYNGLSISSVTVSIVDNDAPAFVINEVDADQTSTDTQEFVEIYDGGVGNVSLNGKTLVLFNGATDTAYTVIPFTASDFTDANGFFVVGDSAVSPTPNKLFSTSSNSVQNGADAVALYSGSFSVGGAVTTTNLIDALVYDTDDPDDTGLLVLLQSGQAQINENQNGLGTTQSMSRVPDGDSTSGGQRQTSSYVEQTPTPGTFNQAQTYGVQVLQSAGRIDVQEGGATDSFQLALLSIPTANVQITVDPDNQTDLGAGPGAAIVLTFTPANALIPQTVTVTAVDDAVVEGDHTSTITHTVSSSDSHYNGLAVNNVVANIVDNDLPPPTSIVISEIMYDPASDETAPGVGEWIEVVNTGTASADLGGWKFDDEDATNWGSTPNGTVLAPNQVAVFFDAAFTDAGTFRSEWGVPAGALVVGVSWGSLSNNPSGPGDEVITLLNNVGIQMDVVDYDNSTPWPSDSEGHSIYLTNLAADNNNGANWARSIANTSKVVSPTGPTFSTSDVGSPGRFFLPADYNTNGLVDASDYVLWRKTLGSTTQLQADGSGPSAGVPNGVVDSFDYTYWRSNYGTAGAATGASAASGLDVANTMNEPLIIAPSPSNPAERTAAENRTVANIQTAPDGSTAVDAAVMNFRFVPAVSNIMDSNDSIPVQSSPQIVANSTGMLLLDIEPALMTQSNDDSLVAVSSQVENDTDAVDHLFATLETADLVVLV